MEKEHRAIAVLTDIGIGGLYDITKGFIPAPQAVPKSKKTKEKMMKGWISLIFWGSSLAGLEKTLTKWILHNMETLSSLRNWMIWVEKVERLITAAVGHILWDFHVDAPEKGFLIFHKWQFHWFSGLVVILSQALTSQHLT